MPKFLRGTSLSRDSLPKSYRLVNDLLAQSADS